MILSAMFCGLGLIFIANDAYLKKRKFEDTGGVQEELKWL